jgi:hypothetical protein
LFRLPVRARRDPGAAAWRPESSFGIPQVTRVIVGDEPKQQLEKEEIVRVSREFPTLGRVTALVGAISVLLMLGCGGSDDPVNPGNTTQVYGVAKLPAGSAGDLSNAKVSLYIGLTEWNANTPVKFAAVTGAGAQVNWAISDNVVPGNYYLDVWKDIDNSGTWSVGDFVGWYGSGGLGSPALTPFSVAQGQGLNLGIINMYLIVNPKVDPRKLATQ